MIRGPEQTLLLRRNSDIQQMYEKMLHINSNSTPQSFTCYQAAVQCYILINSDPFKDSLRVRSLTYRPYQNITEGNDTVGLDFVPQGVL